MGMRIVKIAPEALAVVQKLAGVYPGGYRAGTEDEMDLGVGEISPGH